MGRGLHQKSERHKIEELLRAEYYERDNLHRAYLHTGSLLMKKGCGGDMMRKMETSPRKQSFFMPTTGPISASVPHFEVSIQCVDLPPHLVCLALLVPRTFSLGTLAVRHYNLNHPFNCKYKLHTKHHSSLGSVFASCSPFDSATASYLDH